jgi:hypothetical protein
MIRKGLFILKRNLRRTDLVLSAAWHTVWHFRPIFGCTDQIECKVRPTRIRLIPGRAVNLNCRGGNSVMIMMMGGCFKGLGTQPRSSCDTCCHCSAQGPGRGTDCVHWYDLRITCQRNWHVQFLVETCTGNLHGGRVHKQLLAGIRSDHISGFYTPFF